MGNYLGVAALVSGVMATERPAAGIAHYTVVPENFEPEETTNEAKERATSRE